MKDPLEYLNDVKVDISEYDETPLNDIEKQKFKSMLKKTIVQNNRGKKPLKLIRNVSGLAIAITACTLTFGIYFPTYAENIPGLRQVVSFLNRNDDITGYDKVSTQVIKNIKGDGYDLNIESAYYNGKEVTLFYNVIGVEKLNQNLHYWFDGTVDLDNGMDSNSMFNLVTGEFIDDYTYAGMITVSIFENSQLSLPEKLNCTINFKNLTFSENHLESYFPVFHDNMVELKGEPLTLSLDSSNIEVKEYEINKNVQFNGQSMDLVNAKLYPTEIFIELKNHTGKYGKSLPYIIWDSKKGQLSELSGADIQNGNSVWKYGSPSENSEIYFIPYGLGEIIEPEKVSLTLEKSSYDLQENGTLEILDVYDEGDKTYMKVHSTGLQSISYFGLRGDNGVWFITPLYPKDKNVLGLLDMEVTYVFNKLDREKNYYLQKISSEVTPLDDQIIKIR